MIREIEGNLLDWPENVNVMVHQANCFHTFGGGIARAIAQKYPEAPKADEEQSIYGDENKLGTFTVVKLADGKRIVNLYGQHKTSASERMTNYEALYTGLNTLHNVILQSDNAKDYVIGIPYGIGCGLGKASWRIIKTMIEVIFGKSDIPVVIVRLPNTPEFE